MRIYFRWAALLAAVGAAGACVRARPAAGADQPAFRGVYSVGAPYRSAFRPCGSDEEWYVALSTSAGLELQRRTRMVQDTAPPAGMRRTQAPAGDAGGSYRAYDAGGFYRAYVEVQGDTVALTGGPEMRRYTRELRPIRVLEVRRVLDVECP